MGKYQEIISSTFDLINEFSEKLAKADSYISTTPSNSNIWNELGDEVDKKTEDHRRALFKYSVFIPENIVVKLNEFYDSLFDGPQADVKLKTMEEVIRPYEKSLIEIVELMHKDLGIDKLNAKLIRRANS
jgi:hypothetical protein